MTSKEQDVENVFNSWEEMRLYSFQPSLAFYIETSHLIYTANQMTSFYMKCSTGLKWVKGYNKSKLQIYSKINTIENKTGQNIFKIFLRRLFKG